MSNTEEPRRRRSTKPGFDPTRDIELDARTLRGIAHPLRLRMLGVLRLDGPQTSTSLAARLGESTATTSYHLRMLASYGFVVEADHLGKGRERWWRSAHRSTWFDSSSLDPDTQVLGETYMQSVAQLYIDNMRRWINEGPTYSPEWRAASTLSDTQLRLTAEQADALGTELFGVINRWRDEEERREREGTALPDAAERVAVQLQIFPRGDVPPLGVDATRGDSAEITEESTS